MLSLRDMQKSAIPIDNFVIHRQATKYKYVNR